MRTSKVYDYIIVLKSNFVSKLAAIICAILTLGAALFFFLTGIETLKMGLSVLNGYLYGAIGIFMICWSVYLWSANRRGLKIYFRIALMVGAWGWYMYPIDGKAIALLYLIIALMEKSVRVSPEVAFDKEDIILNSFPQKKFKWFQIKSVKLDKGIFTMEFNQHLPPLKRIINSAVAPEVESEFNQFCQEQLMNVKA